MMEEELKTGGAQIMKLTAAPLARRKARTGIHQYRRRKTKNLHLPWEEAMAP
jgi:hypothetical protein